MKIDDELKEFYEEDKVSKTIDKVNRKMGNMASGAKGAARWAVNILAFIALVLLQLVSVDWAFAAIWKSLTINALLLSLINYLVYLNSGDMGDSQGRKHPDFLSVKKAYEDTKSRITESGFRSKLPEWCTLWSKTELENARKRLFEGCDITYEDYKEKKYAQLGYFELKRLGLGKQAFKAIWIANKMKPIELSPSMLIDNDQKAKRPRRALGRTAQEKRVTGDLLKLVYILASMIFTCSLVLNMYPVFNLATVAAAILSLLLLAYNIISGFMKRYNLIVITAADEMKDQTQYLEEFEKWCNEQNP